MSDNCEKSYTDLCNEALRGLDKLRAAVKSEDWNRAKTFVGFTESKIEELENYHGEDTAGEKDGARLAEEYQGLNGSEILEKVREERSVITGSEDEDTVGDDSYGDRVSSEGEKRDTCDNGRCNVGPSPAASETLEPVAHMSVPAGLMDRAKPYLAEAHLTKYGMRTAEDGEPLVRPDQLFDRLMRIVEEHRHRAEDAASAGNEKERYACESVADVIYDAVMEWKLQIKETQGETSE